MTNPYDAKAIYSIRYSNLLTGHYRMRRRYHIRRPHGTQDWLLIYTIAGRGVFGHVDGNVITRPGDMVLLGPGIPHDYGLDRKLQRWELLWAHFHPLPTWLPLLNWPKIFPGLMRLSLAGNPARNQIVRQFHEVHELATSVFPRYEWLALNAFEGVLLRCDTINPLSELPASLDPRIQSTIEHIHRNLSSPLSLTALAKASHLSISRLSFLFRRQLKTTPQRFIEDQRLDRAKRLLLIPQMRIGEVATEVGYSDPFYFSQRFRRATGFSPRAYRNRQ